MLQCEGASGSNALVPVSEDRLVNRRSVVCGVAGLLAASVSGLGLVHAQEQPAPPATGPEPAPQPYPFSFDQLTERMRQKAGQPFQDETVELAPQIADLSYDQHRAIRFRPDHALWHGESRFELQAFHMGWLFKQPVRIFEVRDAAAHPVTFTGDDFEYRPPLDAANFAGLTMPGVAGFRLHYPLNRPDVMDELVAFLGASYFRGLGRGTLYGLSARGLAVNTATQVGEEFPRFTDFYIEKPKSDGASITIYVAMDSPSVTGAYAFTIVPGVETVMEVTARLFVRTDIERLGIAPMTSMFLYAENNRHAFDDYRPQVHDSDGLIIERASGEFLWRSLNNPASLANSYFIEETPRAFGLYQRDRGFEAYQDADAHYEQRPSLRIEPMGDWGRGAVQLVEIPSDLEVNDNVVAFWVPEGKATAGQSLEYRYRLIWGALELDESSVARVIALRGGLGGVSGSDNDGALRKFVVDFEGGILGNLPGDSEVVAKTNISSGEIVHSAISRIGGTGVWRLAIDVRPNGDQPIEMNAHLSYGEQRLSETWLYQWRPADDRP